MIVCVYVSMCEASEVYSWEKWHWAVRGTQAWAGAYGQSRPLPVWHEQVHTETHTAYFIMHSDFTQQL